MALSKESIISAYKNLVNERGTIVGGQIFARESGISPYYWNGGYWRSWSDFQTTAGYTPNRPTAKIPDEVVLERFAGLALEQGSIPNSADLKLRRQTDPTFPNSQCFDRWGGREALLRKVAEHCEGREQFASVLGLFKEEEASSLGQRLQSFDIKGFVYLLRAGKHYKLGRSNAVGRRLRELAIQLPNKPNTVHVIETDDPEGIERYWHARFAGRRVREGAEWFALTAEDVRAFKKRRFQ